MAPWDGWEPVPVKMRDQGGALSRRGIFRERVPPNHDAGSGPHPTRETAMRFYSRQHRFYCGVDLHARTMHVCVLDHAVAEAILGLDYDGTMIHDGWSPYDQFEDARHQQCLNHLLRRADDLAATATRGAVCFPRRV